jgi:hypothetical protein
MRLVPFEPDHLCGIVPPAMSEEDLVLFGQLYRPLGPAWTGIDGNNVFGCGGILRRGDTGMAWAILSYPIDVIPVHRAVRAVLDQAKQEMGLRRLEARALIHWDNACRWLERLGFRPVGRDGEYGVYER